MELDERVGEVEGVARIDPAEDQSEESRDEETHRKRSDVDRHRKREDEAEEAGLSIPSSQGGFDDGFDLIRG